MMQSHLNLVTPSTHFVIPAQAGMHFYSIESNILLFRRRPESRQYSYLARLKKILLAKLNLVWIPAYAGMTNLQNVASI